jgi:hypothetical protein
MLQAMNTLHLVEKLIRVKNLIGRRCSEPYEMMSGCYQINATKKSVNTKLKTVHFYQN